MNLRFQAVQRALSFAICVLLFAAIAASTAHASTCPRFCLQGMLTRYFDAMVAHDPSHLPLAASARFTEDSQELKLSDGLWKTVTRKGTFRQDYIDQKQQLAAAHIVLFEGDTQVLYSVVLHVADRKIAGIETIVYRVPADAKQKPDQLDKPLPLMNDPVPAGKKMSRAEMIHVAMSYEEGLRVGSFVQANVPFAPEAFRVENGLRTAGEGCSTSKDCVIRTQKIMHHPDIKPSLAVVDEQAGIVLLWMNFGDTHSYGPNKALVTFEAFKIWDGQIHAINAFFGFLPKETERGWPAAE